MRTTVLNPFTTRHIFLEVNEYSAMNNLRKTKHGWMDSTDAKIRQLIFYEGLPHEIYVLWHDALSGRYFMKARQTWENGPLPLWIELG